MNKFRLTLNLLAIAIFMFAFASIAQGQATRTWVSGVGDDVNPCSRTAPCKTYAGAISKTAMNGEISTLDPGGFGAVTITKSITIEGTQGSGYGSILNGGTNGVNINFGSFVAGDARKTVRLRNLNINGANPNNTGLGGNNGVKINLSTLADTKVYIEDCVIDGMFGTSDQRGVNDLRTGTNAMLVINNTTIRNMGSSGVAVVGTISSKVSITRSLISNCAFGISGTNGPQINVFDTMVVSNAGVGIQADGGATIEVDHCVVNNNVGVGFVANGANSFVRVSNTLAVRNASLASTSAGGAVSSYGNNQTGGNPFPSTPTNQT